MRISTLLALRSHALERYSSLTIKIAGAEVIPIFKVEAKDHGITVDRTF